MESFRDVLDRLTQNFVTELLDAVRAAALEQLAAREPKEARPKPTRILRTNHAEVAHAQPAPVVVRKFEIPVGQPRRRRRRAAGTSPARPRKPIAPPQPKVVKFEVVPHPEQKNRRIVLTRLDNA
jgi:hypothetical protein